MDPLAQQLGYRAPGLFPSRPVTRTNLLGASALTPARTDLIGKSLEEEERRKKQEQAKKPGGALIAMLAPILPMLFG